MPNRLVTTALPGYEPEIGRWLRALQEARGRTIALVEGIDQATLDWQGPDDGENAIGSLLYHIALVEMSWLFLDIKMLDALPPEVNADFPHDMATPEGRVTPVQGVSLSVHLDRLSRCRDVFLSALSGIAMDDWHRPRAPEGTGYEVSPAWAVFHLIEHEAMHGGQIGSLKARFGRWAGA